jgi:predicted ABC-type exoprotein transport system permease subunit
MKLDMIKINRKKFNIFTLISLLLLIAGILFYISWIIRFPNAWADIGIYSITIIFVLAGLLGILITLYEAPEEKV